MLQLPDIIQTEIFSYLKLQENKKILFMCKAFKENIDQPSLWKNYIHKEFFYKSAPNTPLLQLKKIYTGLWRFQNSKWKGIFKCFGDEEFADAARTYFYGVVEGDVLKKHFNRLKGQIHIAAGDPFAIERLRRWTKLSPEEFQKVQENSLRLKRPQAAPLRPLSKQFKIRRVIVSKRR